MADEVLTYSVRSGLALGDAEWTEVSAYYRMAYASNDYCVAFCRDGTRLVTEACGLAVKEVRFVRAGFDTEFDASTGKEILFITRKGGVIQE